MGQWKRYLWMRQQKRIRKIEKAAEIIVLLLLYTLLVIFAVAVG